MSKKKYLLGFLLLILIFGYLYFDYKNFLITPFDEKNKEKISFIINKNESANIIANKLAGKKLLKSENYFLIYLKLNGLATEIKAGRFLLSPSQSPLEISKTITDITKGEMIITIPEGYTIEDIADKLEQMELTQSEKFLNCVKETCLRPDYPEIPIQGSLEGYLFPDTYFVDYINFSEQKFLNKILENFHNKWTKLTQNKKLSRTSKDIVIMASIIEKEVKTDPDRPLVADILYKRLDNNWQLGADATIIYATKNKSINADDLKSDSPYNTRKKIGLPPTAISNPGQKSLDAAINPEKNEYWYYLTEPKNGRVIYSVNNDEHNKNRKIYLE